MKFSTPLLSLLSLSVACGLLLTSPSAAQGQLTTIKYLEDTSSFDWKIMWDASQTVDVPDFSPPVANSDKHGNNIPGLGINNPNLFDWLCSASTTNGIINLTAQHVSQPDSFDAAAGTQFTYNLNNIRLPFTNSSVVLFQPPAGSGLTNPTMLGHPDGHFDIYRVFYGRPDNSKQIFVELRGQHVPEPGSLALLAGMGLSAAGFLARRRKNARQAA